MATVAIKDKARIRADPNFVNRVIEEANLPEGNVLLLFNNGPLYKGRYGICIPKILFRFAPYSNKIFMPFVEERWDYAIALSREAYACVDKYPAFFTYLLGHELGHAYVCLLDVKIHIFCCLLDDFYNQVAKKQLWDYEFPHEKLFDQFGMYIAEQLFTRKKLDKEIRELLDIPTRQDHNRLTVMLTLRGTNLLNNLKSDLISFANPYKEKLVKLWKGDIKRRNEGALASVISNLESLFRNK
jgi:hypothetical protein